MPVSSPFHQRTSELCKSLLWKDWAGYFAVRSYDTYVDREYYAIRHAAGLIDVTPLFKYDVVGPDAEGFLSRVTVRNIKKLKVGQVVYNCWCDDAGKVVDDGTVARLGEEYFRVTAADPSLSWFSRFSGGRDVTIEDTGEKIAALSVQGPNSRDILSEISEQNLDGLKYFWIMRSKIAGADVEISRTGYTGDLGFEVWVRNENAIDVYDAILHAGERYGAMPVGLDAMDITRIEAGYILNGVDYYNATHCMIERRKSTPYELGLGWMVNLKKGPFNGRDALVREKAAGPTRVLVGLDIDWDEHEAIFNEFGLPTEIPMAAWRDAIPVYNDAGEQIGYANSGAWSPTLKKNLALATVHPKYEAIGTRVRFEVTVEYERRTVAATVTRKPFFDPARKRA
jgi:aminomethyltransferase